MKTAVVTGVSYGIGKAITEGLLKDDWKVYGLSRTKPAFSNERFVWLKCDLSKSGQITKCLDKVEEQAIDALVSNAGVIVLEPATEVTKESYDWTFSVNLLAPMLLVSALCDKIQKATIISVSSVSDRIAEADMALYCSSKAANTLYFNTLALELKDAKVYTLLPDYVETPMLHSTMDNDKTFDWSSAIKMEDIAKFTGDLLSGKIAPESGSNIIIVTEALKDDLKSREKLYGFNTDTNELSRLSS